VQVTGDTNGHPNTRRGLKGLYGIATTKAVLQWHHASWPQRMWWSWMCGSVVLARILAWAHGAAHSPLSRCGC